MPIPYLKINPDPSTYLSLNTIIEAIAEIIRIQVDFDNNLGVRIYPYWIYEAEPITMFGTVTADIKVNKPDSIEHDQVHAWSIGASTMIVEKGVDGFQTPIMGAQNRQYSRQSNIDIWGFFQDTGKKEAQQKAIDEARLIQAAIQANGSILKVNNPNFDRLGTLDFSNINKTPFSDGSSVIIAAGAVGAFISEEVQVL